MKLCISTEEYLRRARTVLEAMEEKSLDALILWNPTNVYYLTGFAFIPTERPVCLILDSYGTKTIFVPRLELEHAEECPQLSQIVHYTDYPGEKHPMQWLSNELSKAGLASARIGVEAHGYSSPMGYCGPPLSEVVPGARITLVEGLIDEIRKIKSNEEINFFRESAKWGDIAHRLLQRYSKAGLTENQICNRVTSEATSLMVEALGSSYCPQSSGNAGVDAWFRGQIGANSAFPHAMNMNATLRKGDVLVTFAGARLGGYRSELERTMFVGEPSPEQKRFFALMKTAQKIAFDLIRPGANCSDVDKAVEDFYQKNGLEAFWRHHTGHAMGLLDHESPFLDRGDCSVIRPGMVFSIEPGIYVPGLGGFRHSDTVVVTGSGIDFITGYPREIDDLIVG